MKIAKKIKMMIAMALMIATCFGSVMVASGEELPKLSKPRFRSTGTYVVKNNKEFCETITSVEKGSLVYYTFDTEKDVANEGEIYTKPIPVPIPVFISDISSGYEENSVIIKAVAKKEGFADSDVAEREYVILPSLQWNPHYGTVKVKKMKRGTRTITGTLKYNPKMTIYVKVKVKNSKGKTEKYTAKVKNKKWNVKLKNKLKKGNKITVSAYTKHYLVELTEGKKNTMYVQRLHIPGNTWKPAKKTVK